MRITVTIPDETGARLKQTAMMHHRNLSGEVAAMVDEWWQKAQLVAVGSTEVAVSHINAQLGVVSHISATNSTVSSTEVAVSNIESPEDTSVDWTGRAREADELPSDGTYSSPRSNYSIRRKAQLGVVTEAYGCLFPGKVLSEVAAKDLLREADDVAVVVVEAMEEAASREISNLNYIRKIVGTRKAKKPETTAGSDGFVFTSLTPEQKRLQALADRYAESIGWGDEDLD